MGRKGKQPQKAIEESPRTPSPKQPETPAISPSPFFTPLTPIPSRPSATPVPLSPSLSEESRRKHHLLVIEKRIKVADSEFDFKQALLREIRVNWEQGLSNAENFEYEEETKRLETEIGDLLVSKATLRMSLHELAGRQLDAELWHTRPHTQDWAYIDLLVSRLKGPANSTVTMKMPRNSDAQSRWQKSIMAAYGSGLDDKNPHYGWCPITGGWVHPISLTAAHIVRHNVTDLAATHLFGPSEDREGHIWSMRNGISLFQPYERMLDEAMIAIVPANEGKDLMVTVLDSSLLKQIKDGNTPIPIGSDLDGRILKFRTDHRPEKRYLYFSFVVNILRRQRFAVDGWWQDRLKNLDVPFFATPGKRVSESTLRKLAMRIGHMSEGEAKDFVEMTGGVGLEDPFLNEQAGPVRERKQEAIVSYLQYTQTVAGKADDGNNENNETDQQYL
ncbi:hypothetical protein F4861DRAFT_535378 [Xylaria intraflava]|nr:hypothetical protein F4861DRAFT_535378 [Xylaria intraflava]